VKGFFLNFQYPLSSAYRPEIDGLRAFAVLAVLINHLDESWLPGGFLGVDIFFVISGYVVTSSLLQRQERNWRSFIVKFYQRRFRRLLPVLAINVVVVSVLFAMIVPSMELLHVAALRTGIAALFGVSNVYLLRQGSNYFAADNKYNVFLHTWSLGVEEQFYFVWPCLLLLCGIGVAAATRGSLRKFKFICTSLLFCSLGFFIYLQLNEQVDSAFYLITARFWEMASGGLAYLLHRGSGTARDLGERIPIEPFRSPIAGLIFLALTSLMFVPLAWRTLSTIGVTASAAALLILVKKGALIGRIFSHPVAVAIGLLSYSLYLWHWPVIVFFRWTVGIHVWSLPIILLLIVLLTLASYRLETVFRYGTLGGLPLRVYIIVAGSAGVLLGLLQGSFKDVLFAGNRNNLQQGVSNMKKIDGTTVNTVNCFDEPVSPLRRSLTTELCLVKLNAKRPTLYFEGDSHAHALIPIGKSVLADGRWNIAFQARGGCPSPYFEPRSSNAHLAERYRLCGSHFESSVSFFSGNLRAGDQIVLVSNLPGHFATLSEVDRKSAEASYAVGVERLAALAHKRGAGVILFGPIPTFEERTVNIPLSMCNIEWFRPAWSIDSVCRPMLRQRSKFESENARLNDFLRALASRLDHVSLFEPFDSICPRRSASCSTHRGGDMIYSDGNHLTNLGATSIYERFSGFLGKFDGSVSGDRSDI
jgi:peptidoglycan/LPS O-acetylase OafA/YrhL